MVIVHNRKYGRRPAKMPVGLNPLNFYFWGHLPKPPASVTPPSNVDWQMDGNDQYGDCGVAGIKHGFQNAMLVTKETEDLPTEQQVIEFYLNYTDGKDTGVVLSDFLKYVEQNGFYSHGLTAYAPVDYKDVATLQFAISAYTFAYTGIVVTPEMQEAFGQGQPWELQTVLGQPEGGHCIPLVGYDSQYLYAVTWGQVQPIAYSAWAHIATESWAVLSEELINANGNGTGLNLDALKADISKLER